jgi:hypothetical protein
VEYLLRIATRDYQQITHKDGFEKIFRLFCNHGTNVSPRLKSSVEKFNTIRNDLEHRNIPPDFNFLQKILKDVSEFIIWLMKTHFNQRDFDLYQISLAETSEIHKDFHKWGKKSIDKHLSSNKLASLYSSFLICVIPSTYNPNLVDLGSDSINHLKQIHEDSGLTITTSNDDHHPPFVQYINDIRPTYHGIPISTPDYIRIKNDVNDIIVYIFKDGRVYIRKTLKTISQDEASQKFIFDLARAINQGSSMKLNVGKAIRDKYNCPISQFSQNFINDVLKIVLFGFSPECKVKLVRNPTEYFNFQFWLIPTNNTAILQKIYLENLDPNLRFWGDYFRQFIGEDSSLKWNSSGKYSDIEEIMRKSLNYFAGYFKNENYIGFR